MCKDGCPTNPKLGREPLHCRANVVNFDSENPSRPMVVAPDATPESVAPVCGYERGLRDTIHWLEIGINALSGKAPPEFQQGTVFGYQNVLERLKIALENPFYEPFDFQNLEHKDFAKALDVPRDYSKCRFCGRSMDLNDPCCSRQAENPAPSPRMGVNADDTHEWITHHDLECCKFCGVVRRTDRQNSFCRGLVKMRNPEAMMQGKDDV